MMNFTLLLRALTKRLFLRIKNERLEQNFLQALPFWIGAFITGIIAILYAKSFVLAEKLTSIIFSYHAWLLFIITPICFITSWWLVKKFAPFSGGSGIPQVMASIEMATPKYIEKIKKLLSLRIVVIKYLSSIVMMVGGGAIGREGPTIQIAGSVFRAINNLLPNWWPKISEKNMIMTGAASGLAAAFNSPLAGVVFAVEELTKMHLNNFKAAVFAGVIIAGFTVQSLLGSYLFLGYPTVSDYTYYMHFGVLFVAVTAGLLGSGMAKIMWSLIKWKDKFKRDYQHLIYLLFCSLTIVTIAYFINEGILGSGRSLMTTTLFSDNKYVHWYMPILRTVGPILSFTTGASGGIFAPALSGGASVGSVISSWFQLSASNTNIMILAGMVAFLTGVTRAPFTSAIVVLEMTNSNNLILFLMLSAIVANFVSILIDKHSIYEYLKFKYLHEILSEEEMKDQEESISET